MGKHTKDKRLDYYRETADDGSIIINIIGNYGTYACGEGILNAIKSGKFDKDEMGFLTFPNDNATEASLNVDIRKIVSNKLREIPEPKN